MTLHDAKGVELTSGVRSLLMRVDVEDSALIISMLSNTSLDEIKRDSFGRFGIPVDPEHGDPSLIISDDTGRISVHFTLTKGGQLLALVAELVLVDVNDVLVSEHRVAAAAFLHISQVSTDDQRSLRESPQGEMRPLFNVAQQASANLEHVGIVPVTGTSHLRATQVLKEVGLHRLPRVDTERDVLGGAPRV